MKRQGFELWGLTGGIASGKSAAARFFAEAGIPVIDADAIAAQLRAPGGAAHDAILKRFGTAERAKLRTTVFADPKARKDLEAILHPLIQMESLRQMQELAAQSQARGKKKVPIIYEATLLVETGRYKDQEFAGLIVVDAPREARKQRLMARDRMDDASAERILSSQIADDERRKAASVVLENSGSLEALRSRVSELIKLHGWA